MINFMTFFYFFLLNYYDNNRKYIIFVIQNKKDMTSLYYKNIESDIINGANYAIGDCYTLFNAKESRFIIMQGDDVFTFVNAKDTARAVGRLLNGCKIK